MKKSMMFLFVFMAAVMSFAQVDQSGAEEQNDRLGACKAVSAEIEAEVQLRSRYKLQELIGQMPEDLESFEKWVGENNDTSIEDIRRQVEEDYKEELIKYCQ